MNHLLVTAAFLIAAVVCYMAGIRLGTLLFVAAGFVLESVFWFRLLRRRRTTQG